MPARDAWHAEGEPPPAALTFIVRGVWLGIAVLGLVALVNDIRDIAAVT